MTILQRVRFLMWAVAGLTFAGAVMLSVVSTARTNTHLEALHEQDQRTQVSERKQATTERLRLLEGQHRMEVKYDALLATQTRIVAYLNGRGIYVPPSVLELSSTDDNGSGSSNSSTDGSGKQSPSKSAPRTKPKPDTSGGSGKGQGAGGGHDKGHRGSDSKGHSGSEGKGHAKGKAHKRG